MLQPENGASGFLCTEALNEKQFTESTVPRHIHIKDQLDQGKLSMYGLAKMLIPDRFGTSTGQTTWD